MTNEGAQPERVAGPAVRARLTTAIVMMLARRTPYLETEMLGLRALVRPGSVCLDIGAAAGLYTLALSRLAGPSGQVHSVEPLEIARPVWTRVLGARSARNVRHHNVALGTDPGEGMMSVPIRHRPVTGRSFLTTGSHGLGSNAEFRDQMSVPVRVETLDGLCAEAGLTRLDFVKIDVEGAELRVLEGGQRTIEGLRPALLLEIEARHTERFSYSPQDIVSWLAQRGYTMHTWQAGWRETREVSERFRNYLFRAGPAGQAPASRPAATTDTTAAGTAPTPA